MSRQDPAAPSLNSSFNGPSTRDLLSSPNPEMGTLQCCICGREDKEKNLHAAGAYHAKNSKTNSEHVRVLTEKWREMALNVNNEILLNRPAFGDVASKKLFYQSSCYKSLEYENDRILKENDDNDSESWAKAFALNKVVTYLYEENEKSPGHIFSVNILEKKIDELALHGIYAPSQVTRFTLKLTSSVDGLIAKSENRITTVCFEETVDNLYWAHCNSPQSFIKQLRTIIDPIRKDNFEKDNSFDGSFDEDSQTQSVPTRLSILKSFLLFGTCEGTSSFCQATLTCANCKKKTKEK